jgi:hypothetical protein
MTLFKKMIEVLQELGYIHSSMSTDDCAILYAPDRSYPVSVFFIDKEKLEKDRKYGYRKWSDIHIKMFHEIESRDNQYPDYHKCMIDVFKPWISIGDCHTKGI